MQEYINHHLLPLKSPHNYYLPPTSASISIVIIFISFICKKRKCVKLKSYRNAFRVRNLHIIRSLKTIPSYLLLLFPRLAYTPYSPIPYLNDSTYLNMYTDSSSSLISRPSPSSYGIELPHPCPSVRPSKSIAINCTHCSLF